MSAKYKSPSFLLPNELNTSANTANDTGINSLYSMNFDGSSEYINVGSTPQALVGNNSAYTVSAWAKPDTTGNQNIIGAMSSGNRWYFRILNGYASYAYGSAQNGNDYQGTATPVALNTWSHIVFTFDGSTTHKIYVNGVLKLTQSNGSGQTITNSQNAYIGALNNNGSTQNDFYGQIDEVAIFNRALNTTEIAALYGGTSPNIYPSNLMASNLGPIAYYPLGEQAQNSGYPSATGNEWQFPNGVLQDYVMDFDGSNTEYIDTNFTGLNNTSAVTISAWMNIPVFTNLYALGNLHYDSGTYKGIGFNPATSSAFVYINNNTSNVAYFTFNPSSYYSAGNWFNIVFVFDGSESGTNRLKVYIDKNLVTGTWTGTPLNVLETSTSNFLIGNDGQQAAPYFTGQISNVAIWNTAITDSAQIANIYNNGSPQTNYTVTPQNWWKLNADSVYTPSAPNYTTVLDFDGNNDLVNANSVISSISSSTTGTVSGWIKYTTGGSAAYMITFTSNTNTSQQYLTFQGNSNGVAYAQIKNQWILQTNNAVFTSGNWYHYAVTQNGTEPKIYINGTEYSNGNGAALTTYGGTDGTEWWPDLNSFNTVTIGGMVWNSGGTVYTNYGNQDLSNISIFNSALTATQISSLFNFGTPETAISFSPTAWWKLDDQNAITDSSGNGYTGTNNGATNSPGGVAVIPSWKIPSALPITTTPNYTTALDFDGSDFIDLGRPASLNLMPSVDEFSISAWFKTSAQGTIYSFGAPSSNSNTQIKIAIRGGDYLPEVVLKGTATTIGSTTYNDGNWHNIVLTCTTSTANLYIDGSNVGSPTIGTATITSTDNGAIGARTAPTGGFFFNGSISNVSICNTNLSASQVSTLYNNGTPETAVSFSPVSWWKLDTGGSTITDYAGSNNGTNNGASPITSNVLTSDFNIPVNGVSTTLPSTALQQSDLQFDSPFSNYSLSFDGAGGYIDCTDNDMFSFGNGTTDSPFSVSFWAKLNSVSGTQPFLSKDTANPNREWAISIFSDSSNGVRIFLKNQGGNSQQSIDSSTALTTGVWYHITTTYDGRGGSDAADGLNIYINGILDTPTNISKGTYTAMSNTTAPVYIGKYSSSEINGKIDETAIFNTALTEAQVLEIYNNGKPGDLDNFSGTAPISWWRLGENAYFVNNDITLPNSIAGAPNGVSSGTATSMLSADAPGTYANGIGDGLAITDRVGDAPLSVANSQSYNMIPDDKVPYVPGYVGTQITNTFEMTFDGVGDYFDAGVISALSNVSQYSVSLWANIDTGASGILRLFGNRESSSPYNGIGADIDLSASLYFYLNGGPSYPVVQVANISNYVTAGTWFHLVCTFNAGQAYVYIDGVQRGSDTGGSTADTTTNPLYIGADSINTNSYFYGLIDEVAIFDKALTADQIKFDLYNATTTGKTADIENNTNLPTPVAWYRMGD